LNERLVDGIARAERERLQQLGHHPWVMRGIRGAQADVHLVAVGRPTRFRLAHQVVQLLFTAGGRKDHVAYLAVRVLDRSLGDAEQHAGLPRHTFQVVQQLLVDPLLGAHADFVDDLNEQVDEAVSDLASTEPAQRRHQRGTQCRRVRP